MSTRKNTNKIKSIREKSDKIINENKNIRDLEKRYLKGEKHKEISDIPEKEIKTEKDEEISNQNNDNNTNNKIESKSNQLLKEKLSNIDINIKALNGINKSMEKQIKNIEKDILENQIPKRVIKINTKKTDKISNFEDKAKLKTIKGLNDSKNYLNSKLQQILLNEKYLKNEGNIENLNLSDKYVSLVDQNIYENKKIILENKKEQLITKISQIEEDLKTLSLSGDELSRRNRIKHYLQNFEKDKKIIESRAKKYYQESIERNKRIENDLNKKYDKMKKEYEEKKAEEKAKQIETLKKMKEKEKLILEKRTKENDEKYNKYKPYLSRKMKENIKDYLFIKKEETYKNEEQKLVEKENLRRKEKMKIDFNEINDFGKNVNEHIEKTKTEQNERKKKLLSEWKERKSSLPNYTLNLNRNKGETEEENTEKENEMQTLREKKEKMKIFAYDIKNNKQPEINEKLKNKRMLLIQSLENPKLAAKLSHKLLFQKYKRFSDEANKESNNNKNLNKVKKEIKLNNSLSPKRSKQKLFPLHPKSKTRIDYLTEMITKKEKEINDKNGNVIENIDYIKQQAKLIDNKVKQKGQYLKLTGGVENNPEVGNEMSELIIDSIGAKLTILNVYK